MTERALLERELWRILEAVHAAVYFVPEAKATYGELGLRGYWMGYFASRSAPLGTPGPRLVTALFYGFAPRMVERALPDAWQLTDPARVLDTRLELARSALGGHTGDGLAAAAERLTAVLGGLDVAGRPLAAAHLDVQVPTDPLGRLWHAATVLREYRGWTEQEWADAAERLRSRGLLDEAGEKTSLGRELRAEIERSTDRSAA